MLDAKENQPKPAQIRSNVGMDEFVQVDEKEDEVSVRFTSTNLT